MLVEIPILPGHLTRIISFIFLSRKQEETERIRNSLGKLSSLVGAMKIHACGEEEKSANRCVLQGSPHQRKQKEPGSWKRLWFWIWWHRRIWILNDWKVSLISSLSWSSSWSPSSSSSSTTTWYHIIASSFIIILHNFLAENSLGWLFHNARLSFSKSLQCDAIT